MDYNLWNGSSDAGKKVNIAGMEVELVEKILEMKNITKRFPGVLALDNVSMELYRGEILALLGENGAGKSTLMKILAGAYIPDSGKIYLNGKELEVSSPKEMLKKGVAVVYQELNYYNDLSIAENIFIQNLPKGKLGGVDFEQLYKKTETILKKVGLNYDPRTLVSNLSVAEKQMIEIAKAISKEAKVLVMDEPTSSLNEAETENLFALLREMTKNGISVIYISHKMSEIFALTDRVEVLRDGCYVGTVRTNETNVDELVSMMVGRTITDMYPKKEISLGRTILEVKNLRADRINNVSFQIRAGEIVGLFGLMGSGRTEIAEMIFGKKKIHGGTVLIDGEEVHIEKPSDAIKAGIGYVPRERKQEGLVLTASLGENIAYASLKELGKYGFMQRKKEKQTVLGWIEKLRIKAPGWKVCINSLSGGNQQKAVIAKWLQRKPKVLILNEPTRGIDVGAKVEIYRLMEELCQQGMAILVISSEMPEIMGIADKIVIVHEGSIKGECGRQEFSQEKLMHMAIGGTGNG